MKAHLAPILLFAGVVFGSQPQLHGQADSSPGENTQDSKPLYMHWFKPFYRGNGDPPAHILSLRVTPSTDFEVHFRDPAFTTRKCTIKGRIDKRDGRYVGDVECIWKSGTGFAGEFKLDRPNKGRPLGFASAYYSTHVVLSHQRAAGEFLDRGARQPKTEESPAKNDRAKTRGSGMHTIRVIDGDTGGPIVGATFTYDPGAKSTKLNLEGTGFDATAASNERGEVQLPVNTVDFLQFRVTHPQYLRSRFAPPSLIIAGTAFLAKTAWPYGDVDGQKVIRLWRAETLTGTIQFTDGTPAAGMDLQVWGTINDLEWMKNTGEGIWSRHAANAWQTEVQTNADGRFAIAVPPRARREAFSVLSTSLRAGPFERAFDSNDIGTIEIPRGAVVRGVMLDSDGKPATKTLVELRPDALQRDPKQVERPDFTRRTSTDENGRFQLALAAPGTHILRPYTCLPQRLEIRQEQKAVDVEVRVAPVVDLKFSASDTRASKPGVQNVSLRGEIAVDGGAPIPYTSRPFDHNSPGSIIIRAPLALRNAELHLHNFPHQVVHVTDESGKEIPAGPDPIKIPDLSVPPKIKIWLSSGAPLQLNILEADGKEARDIEVTGVATGRYGVRKLGAFHRRGSQWESPGLYEGERVTVTVKQRQQSVNATADPIRLDSPNTLEVLLP